MKTAKDPRVTRRHVERFLASRLIVEVGAARQASNEVSMRSRLERADAIADALRAFLNRNDR